MAKYRGRHSRFSEDGSSLDRSSTAEQPYISRLQPEKRPTNSNQQPKKHGSFLRGRNTSRNTTRRASPDAFKHHDAVHENGESSRHSKGKTVLIIIPLALVLIAVIAGIVYAVSSLSNGDNVEPGIAVTVSIPDGATTDDIASVLKQANVIKDTQAFIKDVQNMGAESKLKPGTYQLETRMDTTILINTLVAGPSANGTKLTIPEGYTVEQTAAVVEKTCGIAASKFLERAYAADEYVSEYSFLEGAYNNSLEGFLYPKTYSIPTEATADYVIRVMLNQFALETSTLDLSYAEEHGLNLFNVITTASLIERETGIEDERPQVSSVIYNRLSAGMKLQIDATVVYALGSEYSGSVVTYDDLEVDSPYNTYKVDELPAGPICSPSIESIEAAAHPAKTEYYYYVVTSKEGYHTFCATIEEFEAAKEEYNSIFGIE